MVKFSALKEKVFDLLISTNLSEVILTRMI